MTFDRKEFFKGYRGYWPLGQQQVRGLERLLGAIESDPHIPDNEIGLYWAAYILATVKRETAHTFTPIHEYGGKSYFIKRYGGQTRKGKELGNDTPDEGYYYAGKGDVQTTGESNYEKAEIALRREYPEIVADFERRTGKTFDLTVGDQPGDASDPQNILDPAISYAVMSYGMRTGMFTGRKLSQYTRGKEPNYLGMRAIVNGTDHDDEIAADAVKFEKILRDSAAQSMPASHSTPVENEDALAPDPAASHVALPEVPPIINEPPPGNISSADLGQQAADSSEPAVAVQTVSADLTTEKTPTGIKGMIAAGVAFLTSLGSGVFSLFQGLGPVITISFFASAALVAIAFMGFRYKTNKNNAELKSAADEKDKQRAHDLQMLIAQSAASKTMNTIALVPPPVLSGAPDTAGGAQ